MLLLPGYIFFDDESLCGHFIPPEPNLIGGIFGFGPFFGGGPDFLPIIFPQA
tara:strand:+ start:61 stop:216 length:156 start_codon:yes stop_codon:yes gene_type:complete